MDGVTILETIDVYQIAWWQFLLGLLPLILSAVIFFIRERKAFKKGTVDEQERNVISVDNWSPKELLTLFVGGILTIFLTLYFGKYMPADYVETKYKVKVEDSVSFNELYSKYVIIEEQNNIFTIKEKNS